MDSHVETGAIVGSSSRTHWAQVIKTPYAYGVVEIEDETGKAQTLGMNVIHALEQVISEPIFSTQEIFDVVDHLMTIEVQTLLLCIPIDHMVTIILRGAGVVYLKRDGHIAMLKSREGTSSGVVHPSDILFLSSKTCLLGVSEEEFFSFFDHVPVDEIAEKLMIHIHKKNGTVGYAGLFIEFENKESVQNVLQEEKPKNPRVGVRISAIKQRIRSVSHTLRNLDVRITMVLLALFIISIGIGIVKERTGKRSTAVTSTMTKAQMLYDEGVALIDLNLVKSRERLTQAKQEVEKLKPVVSQKSKDGRKIAELEKKITESLSIATKEYDVTPELFFDVSLLKSGSTISSFGLYEDMMALLDGTNKTVFTLQLATKNGQIVGGGSSLFGAQHVAIHGDMVYVFTPEGISAVNRTDKTVKPLVVKKAADWITIQAMTAFAGNIYLLDTGKGRIWKYVATASAFSDMREFLLPDYFPDLSKSQTMSIDGSVWLGTSTGAIQRFTQGKDDPFLTKGVDPGFGTKTIVFTDDLCTYVYVLDPDNNRVVVLEKDGTYHAQYHYSSPFAPMAIAVSEKLGKLFFFSDGKIYTTELK